MCSFFSTGTFQSLPFSEDTTLRLQRDLGKNRIQPIFTISYCMPGTALSEEKRGVNKDGSQGDRNQSGKLTKKQQTLVIFYGRAMTNT